MQRKKTLHEYGRMPVWFEPCILGLFSSLWTEIHYFLLICSETAHEGILQQVSKACTREVYNK